MLPCALSTLIAITLHARGNKNWHVFVTAAALFDLPWSMVVFGSLICSLIISKENKQARKYVLQMIKSIFLACTIIVFYLLLIEYSFLGWDSSDSIQASHGNRILRFVTLVLSYLTVFIALLNIHAKKNTEEH